MAVNNEKIKWSGNELTIFIFYAGLIVCCVPFILCDTETPRHLTFSEIYNSTSYAQINPNIRSFSIPFNSKNKSEDTKGSNLEEFNNRYDGAEGLLVGFARDPFRHSIPISDYLKGVREIDPKQYSSKGDRGKRGVFHLYNMLSCATGCDPISYKGYGCYCGFLGSGKPTDGIDNCCRLHDECYEHVHCPVNTVYFQPYYWKCYNRQPHCALENYQTRHKVVNGCSARLCECDRRFAMCVRRYSCPRGRAFCRSDPLRLLQNILMFK